MIHCCSENHKRSNQPNQSRAVLNSFFAGGIAVLVLVFFYWLVLFLITKDPYHPVEQFFQYWHWMSALLLGFGIQIGLFWYVRFLFSQHGKVSKGGVAVGAGTSTGAMIACCLHHVADVIPFFGVSAAALFLSEYQEYLFIIGILSNVVGIFLLVRTFLLFRTLSYCHPERSRGV